MQARHLVASSVETIQARVLNSTRGGYRMKRITVLGLFIFFAAGITMAAPMDAGKTFVGNISDSMCGLKHMMPGGDKFSTSESVKSGSKYVLADPNNSNVYKLNNQKKPSEFNREKI